MTFTHQTDREIGRLKLETEAADKRTRDRLTAIERRCAALEASEAYIRDELLPWLVTFAAFAGFTAPPEPPP